MAKGHWGKSSRALRVLDWGSLPLRAVVRATWGNTKPVLCPPVSEWHEHSVHHLSHWEYKRWCKHFSTVLLRSSSTSVKFTLNEAPQITPSTSFSLLPYFSSCLWRVWAFITVLWSASSVPNCYPLSPSWQIRFVFSIDTKGLNWLYQIALTLNEEDRQLSSGKQERAGTAQTLPEMVDLEHHCWGHCLRTLGCFWTLLLHCRTWTPTAVAGNDPFFLLIS